MADLNTKDQIMLHSPAPDKISPLIKAGWPETLLDHFALCSIDNQAYLMAPFVFQ